MHLIWVTSLPLITGENGVSNLVSRRLMYPLRHFPDYKKMHFSAFLKEQKLDLAADFLKFEEKSTIRYCIWVILLVFHGWDMRS